MTSPSYPLSTSPPHWESRNGYIPPPRFQQLRAQDNQQLLLSHSHNNPTLASPDLPSPAPPTFVQQPPTSSPTPPDMGHARSQSFFSFGVRKQPGEGQSSAIQPSPNTVPATSALPPQQYLPPSNSFPSSAAPGPSRQDQLSPQNIPPSQNAFSPQSQQPNSNFVPSPRPPHQPNQQPQSPTLASAPQPQPSQRPQSQPQQPSTPTRISTDTPNGSQSTNVQPPPPPPLHPEIRSVVQLSIAHAHKIYFSGPLVRRIERQGDGQKPHKDEGWTDVWAQLGGTTLSIWSMKEIQEASKQGKEVPPSYINVTDAVRILTLLSKNGSNFSSN